MKRRPKPKKKIIKNKIKQAEREQDKSRVEIDVDPTDSSYEPIKINIREDVSSIHKISENNEKVYKALLDMGEVQMANHVHMMMERVKVGPKFKYVSEIKENTKELKSVNDSSSKIEKYLDDIRASLKTGQDTSIEKEQSIENVLADEVIANEVLVDTVPKSELPGFIETLLGMMFGGRLIKFLMGSAGKGLMFLAQSILRPALGWLLGAMTAGISGLFKTLMAGPIAIFNSLKDKVYDFIGNTFEKFKSGFDKLKNTVKGIPAKVAAQISLVKDYVKNQIAGVTKRITNFVKMVKSTISKIPGMGKIAEMLGLGDDPKLSDSKKTPSKSKGFIGNLVDSTKERKFLTLLGKLRMLQLIVGRAVYAAGGKVVDWSKGKLADVRKGISEIAKKVGSKFSGIPKRLTDHVNKTGGIPAKGGIMSKLNKFTKVLRPIPFLGQALMVGFAAKSAYDGWNNAGELYGVPQEEVSTSAKAASAVGALVNDLLWPLPVSQATVASMALSLTGGSVTKDGTPLKGNYDPNAPLGDISQLEGPPDDDFQPGGFSDEEILTSAYKSVTNISNETSGAVNQNIGGNTNTGSGANNTGSGANNTGSGGNSVTFDESSHPVVIGNFEASGKG